MADLETLKTWLAEAEAALHKLHTGAMEVSIGSGEERATYNEVQVDKLEAYINKLQDQITRLEGGYPRRVFGVGFNV